MTTVTVRIASASLPAPVPLWVVRGDEELQEYGYMSRTAAADWAYLPLTPCIFRFSPKPEARPTEYRTNVEWLEAEHIRVNDYDGEGFRRCWNYLFSIGTALFNNTGYPKMLEAVMAGNVLQELAVEGDYLKFKTLRFGNSVAGMTHATHPQYVHRWDLIEGADRATTRHTQQTPRGLVYNFLVSDVGYGYLPLKNVRQV